MQKDFSQICQNKGFISSLSGKNMTTIFNFGLFLLGNREESHVKVLESKFGKSYFIHAIPGQCPVKKLLIPTFSTFAAIDHKWHFIKALTRILKFGCFSWYHAYILENNKLNFLMQDLMLNRLAPISNTKNEKARMSFSNCFFILRPISN